MDLLLCAHHYRASIGALIVVGAAVYDQGGAVIPPGEHGRRIADVVGFPHSGRGAASGSL